MMKHIIHDWGDEHCRTILAARSAQQLPPHGRVLVCEQVMPEEPGPAPAKMLDIEMLVMTVGGKERTPREFAELFISAGLKLGRIVTTPTPTCIVGGTPQLMRRQSPKDAVLVTGRTCSGHPREFVIPAQARNPVAAEGAKKNWTPAFAEVTPFEAPTVTSSTAWRRPG